ncbi:hypothetical protein CAJCM15448_43390 [Candidozyma auris]|nr:hypothetical protein CAJCM15448_43390 [[Candida] auris]
MPLFSPSWDAAARAAALLHCPLFVYLSEPGHGFANRYIHTSSTYDIAKVLKTRFAAVELGSESDLKMLMGSSSCELQRPSFVVYDVGVVVDMFAGGSQADFESFLRKHVSELPLKKFQGTSTRRRLSQREEDLKHIRAQIDADKRERWCQRRHSMELAEGRTNVGKEQQQKRLSDSQCSLSIRLLDGSTMQGTFDSSQTLRDVKRWIEAETGLALTPVEDDALPSFAQTSAMALNDYAFCYLGVPRVTFTVGQELTKLSDLGLCPRSALILKPVRCEQERRQSSGLWTALSGKLSSVASALYTFFDYGLEDAELDFSGEADVAQPAFVVPEKPTDVEADDKHEKLVSNEGSTSMASVTSRGNQSHVLHDRETKRLQGSANN